MTTRLLDSPARDRTSVAALIGRTPLVRLRAFEPKPGVEVYAKLESKNPGGSVKDRAALAMVLDGERSGALTKDRILLDATSGNTGIAFAMLGASHGFRVRLCIPANVTAERKRLLAAYGADLVLTDPMEGSDGAIREARRIAAASPRRYFYADQYSNPANWRAHYTTTGVEIAEETAGRITHFVAGLGTSGTFIGTGRRLRALCPAVRLVSVQPESPLHGLEGLKHMASALVPAIYDMSLADENVFVSTEDAYAVVQRLAREEGLLAGPSGGAALAACLRVAATVDRAVIVTVFPDGGERYLTERFWVERALPVRGPASQGQGPPFGEAQGAPSVVEGQGPQSMVQGPASPSLCVPAAVLARVRAHGEASYPHECCGALFGTRTGDIVDDLPITNSTSDAPRRRFLVGPDDYRLAERRAAETGLSLVGFYHSHPDHPAAPSAFDLEHAWPNVSYLIVSVRDGRAGDVRAWRLRADRSGFTEEHLWQSEF
jgi:cysteine synthase B